MTEVFDESVLEQVPKPKKYYVEPDQIEVAGIQTAYRRKGPEGGGGEPVLFLHGNNFTRMWLPLYERLSQSVDLIAPEHPGFGETPAPAWVRNFDDLVLHYDGVFRVFLGGSTGDIDRTPDQLLKVSGNVMHYLLRDVTGDGRMELQVIRGPKISLGQVIRRLVIPGALDFDIYTYENTAGTFSTHPSRRSRLRLEIPGLLSLADREEEESEDQERIHAKRIALSASTEADGIVDVVDETFLVFANAPVADGD